MTIDELVSVIQNNVTDGMNVATHLTFAEDQIKAEIIAERSRLIKEYSIKGISTDGLYQSIRCIELDCNSLERCCPGEDKVKHFRVPQIVSIHQPLIKYVGSTEYSNNIQLYTDNNFKMHKYRRRGANKPYIWIDTTPNNNMYDGYVFNAPFMTHLTIEAIFKNPLELDIFTCCQDYDDFSFLQTEIIERLSKKYLSYYRQLHQQVPNKDNLS